MNGKTISEHSKVPTATHNTVVNEWETMQLVITTLLYCK